MAKPKRRTRDQAVAPSVDRGTPETRAKLGHDPLLWLLRRRDDFLPEHLRAAEEIGSIYEAIARPLGVRQMATEPAVDGSKRREPMWLPHRLERPYRDVYIPWTNWLRAHGCGDLVMACVIERVSLRDLCRAYRIGHARAGDTVTLALRWYAEQAGWLRRVAA